MKFSQFQVIPVDNNVTTQSNAYLFALGEDGKVYMTTDTQVFTQGWWAMEKTEG